MATQRGYLLIADLSGYTAYLTSTELEHANGVISALLEVMVERIEAPLQLWRLEGDAVLAYTTDPSFPSGETLLTICEDLYNAFAQRRQDIEANSTCPCKACEQVSDLDLKLMVHHGAFEPMEVGQMRDISGADVILVHRLAKTDVKKNTGIESYALVTDAAWKAMSEPPDLRPYAESFEHFGEVQMHVYDLAAAWKRLRAARRRVVVHEDESLWTHRFHLAVPPAVAWQILVSTRAKRRWMELKSATIHAANDRPGPGARYHCVHEIGEFTSWVEDWQPFDYVTNRYLNALHPELSHYETYALAPTPDGGTDVRYTMGSMFDPARPDAGPFPEADAELSGIYESMLGPWCDALARETATDASIYA